MWDSPVKRRENPLGCWEFPATPLTSPGQQQQERKERRFKPRSSWEVGRGGGGGQRRSGAGWGGAGEVEVEVYASKLTAALHPSSRRRLDPIRPRRQRRLSRLTHQRPDEDGGAARRRPARPLGQCKLVASEENDQLSAVSPSAQLTSRREP